MPNRWMPNSGISILRAAARRNVSSDRSSRAEEGIVERHLQDTRSRNRGRSRSASRTRRVPSDTHRERSRPLPRNPWTSIARGYVQRPLLTRLPGTFEVAGHQQVVAGIDEEPLLVAGTLPDLTRLREALGRQDRSLRWRNMPGPGVRGPWRTADQSRSRACTAASLRCHLRTRAPSAPGCRL